MKESEIIQGLDSLNNKSDNFYAEIQQVQADITSAEKDKVAAKNDRAAAEDAGDEGAFKESFSNIRSANNRLTITDQRLESLKNKVAECCTLWQPFNKAVVPMQAEFEREISQLQEGIRRLENLKGRAQAIGGLFNQLTIMIADEILKRKNLERK